jgi:hypothetical protein
MCCLYGFDLNISSLDTSAVKGGQWPWNLQVFLGKCESLKHLLLLDNAVDNGLERFVVRLLDSSLLW